MASNGLKILKDYIIIVKYSKEGKQIGRFGLVQTYFVVSLFLNNVVNNSLVQFIISYAIN